MSEARCWIIAYDITEPRRLRQVHAYLVKHAYALQYSVFLAVCTERHLERILSGIEGQIHHKLDDVRAYPLPEGVAPVCLGVMYTSDFALLTGLEEGARGFLGREWEA